MIRILAPFFGAMVYFALSISGASASVSTPPDALSKETKECVKCHKRNNPGIVQQWGNSKHYRANVGCYECHQADGSDSDAFIHDDKKSKSISRSSSLQKIARTATPKKSSK